MPQVIAAMVVGASVYAGFKWLSKVLGDAQNAAKRMDEEARQKRARATSQTAKDLGALELDPETGVYRPRQTSRS
jgi:membrane protein implicated in regulation of membrane protease activity